MQVLSNVAQRLADMHDAGYVHRDVKPANVMWLPRQNRWTLIDFGCVARLGEEAPVNFTLAYAAPEVAVACRCRHMRIEARAELDAWSLGVMAFELLTGSPAFDLLTYGRSKVRFLHKSFKQDDVSLSTAICRILLDWRRFEVVQFGNST